ncbi:MAG: xanthine dehydrogenase family protein subunit M [Isosphaeraceae bacterium]
MKAFEYVGPSTVAEAVTALAGGRSAEALSGGTDLLCRLKDYVGSADRVVYLNDIKDLAGISSKEDELIIGAGTRLSKVLDSKEIKEKYPALHQATLEVGTPQIRNMATVGGNLLQRPRCWYFRNGFGILGLKDGKSLIREGDNRYHSIFMTDGNALFVNPSSLAVPLIALGAHAKIQGPHGERTVPVEQLYRVPKTNEERENTLAHSEVLLSIHVPAPKGKNGSYEVRQKQAHDWPLVMAAVNLVMDGETVSDARVVIYGVAPVPWRSESAEQAIKGKKVSHETATAVGTAAISGAKPLSMNAYKVGLVSTAVKRALLASVGNRYWEA